MPRHGQQQQRHGVNKNLAEGFGGLIVGAAIVLLVTRLIGRRTRPVAATPEPSVNPGQTA